LKKHPVLQLRPTQFAVGMREVEHKGEKLKAMKPKELDDYIHSMPVPIVLGPKGRTYIIDHHHLARAAWEVGIPELVVEQKADFSALPFETMWRTMQEAHWVYLVDQLGNGPHDALHLPETIKGLADDPYRSVAWVVRNKEGFQKNPTPFSEFRWAEFFRKNLKAHPVHDEFDAAVNEALQLAKTAACKDLPGYIPR
jgi:hypothetical protein